MAFDLNAFALLRRATDFWWYSYLWELDEAGYVFNL